MAYPFAAAEVLTAVDLNAMIGAPTQNAITTVTYTAVLLDAGKTVTLSNASAVTLTIPAQASVAWAANTQLNFLNIGAGTVTIVPAATVTINGTPLTLTTSQGGSLVRTASNTWTFIPTGAGGKVLQVVSVTKVDSFTMASATYADVTGLTASITPSATSSKILVLSKVSINPRSDAAAWIQLVRGAVVIGGGTAVGSRPSAASAGYANGTFGTDNLSTDFLDSPASVSSQTYKIQAAVANGTLGVNTSGSDSDASSTPRTSSTMILMEISA